MPVTPSGRKINISANRPCKKCGRATHQICYGIRYVKDDLEGRKYRREMFWVCTICLERNEEVKEIPEKTERLMVVERLMRLTDDYELKHASIEAQGNRLVFTIEFPEFDMARLRDISARYEEEGFIRLSDLLLLRKAGSGIRPRYRQSQSPLLRR